MAKFVATGYDAKSGKLIASSDPQYDFSHQTNHTVLLFFSWQTGRHEQRRMRDPQFHNR